MLTDEWLDGKSSLDMMKDAGEVSPMEPSLLFYPLQTLAACEPPPSAQAPMCSS